MSEVRLVVSTFITLFHFSCLILVLSIKASFFFARWVVSLQLYRSFESMQSSNTILLKAIQPYCKFNFYFLYDKEHYLWNIHQVWKPSISKAFQLWIQNLPLIEHPTDHQWQHFHTETHQDRFSNLLQIDSSEIHESYAR